MVNRQHHGTSSPVGGPIFGLSVIPGQYSELVSESWVTTSPRARHWTDVHRPGERVDVSGVGGSSQPTPDELGVDCVIGCPALHVSVVVAAPVMRTNSRAACREVVITDHRSE